MGASLLVCSGLQNARAHDIPSTAVGTALGTSVSVGAGAQGFRAEAVPNGVWLRQILRQQARFWNISYPLLAEGADVCRKLIRPGFGFVAFTRWDIDRYYRIASMSSYGLDDRLRVVHVLPGSPAAKAGLRAGDVIEGIGHHAIPLGRAASAAVDRVVDGEVVVGVAQTFHVRRREQRLALAIAPRMQCDVNLVVTDSDRINAFNDGRTIYVTHGLLRYFADDRALTAVAAHLIGHGLLEHRAGQDEGAGSNVLQGRLESLRMAFLGNEEIDQRKRAGTLPGALAYTTEQEIEATVWRSSFWPGPAIPSRYWAKFGTIWPGWSRGRRCFANSIRQARNGARRWRTWCGCIASSWVSGQISRGSRAFRVGLRGRRPRANPPALLA